MDLELTDDQEQLRDAVREFLVRECNRDAIRAIVDDGAPRSFLWPRMVELGWPALTVSERAGGLGLGAVELALVAEELGRALAPGPLLATASQYVPAVRELAGPDAPALGAVAAGERTGSLALTESTGSWDPADVHATATPLAGGYRLAGTKRFVMEGTDVDELVIVARLPETAGDDGVIALAAASSALDVRPIAGVDLTRGLTDVVLDGVEVPTDAVLGEPGPPTARGLRRAAEESALALAMETVGACQALFDETLAYAKEREQFGVPIGSFQALKHRFADMLVLLERARSTGYFAALTIAEDDDRRTVAVSVAKAAAGDCEALVGKEGIQMHGGIGFTWEQDTHLFARRMISDGALFGTAVEHRVRIADALGL